VRGGWRQAFEQVLAVREGRAACGLPAARVAKLEIERLLTVDARKHRERIVE